MVEQVRWTLHTFDYIVEVFAKENIKTYLPLLCFYLTKFYDG